MVDCDEEALALTRAHLHVRGFSVMTAVDGLSALDTIKNNKIDLVVSEVELSTISGFTLSSRIKRSAPTCDVPLIFYSSLLHAADTEIAMLVGASACVSKASGIHELLKTIDDVTHFRPATTLDSACTIEGFERAMDLLTKKIQANKYLVDCENAKKNNAVSRLKPSRHIEHEGGRRSTAVVSRHFAAPGRIEINGNIHAVADKTILAQRDLELIFGNANIGYWVKDKFTGELTLSKEMLAILGLTELEFEMDRESIYWRIHPDDLQRTPKLTEILESRSNVLEAEYRIKKRDGTIRWVYQKADFTNVDKVVGIIQDITERKTCEEILEQYNQRFEILSATTNDAIWDLDFRLNFMVWNHALRKLFGYSDSSTELTSTWWENKIHPADRPATLKAIAHAIDTHNTSWSSTYRFRCANGEYKHVFNRAHIIYERGRPVRIIGSMQDISDQVAWMEEKEKLSLVASKTNSAVMITDREHKVEWVNESFSRITGHSFENVKGKHQGFLWNADGEIEQRINEKLRRFEVVTDEVISCSIGNKNVWLKLDIVPVLDEVDKIKHFISIYTDITELKEYENSITTIAQELAALIENANVPIFGFDNSQRINEWNSVCAGLSGFSKGDVMGRHWKELIHVPESIIKFDKLVNQTYQHNTVSNFEFSLESKTGEHYDFLLSSSVRRNAANETAGIIFVGQNISELTNYRNNLEKMVEERTRELHAALTKEKELVRLKSQFVSIASHEFRTPLTSIGIAAAYIRKYKSRLSWEDIEKKLLNIDKQVNHMTYLLDDILVVGKAEAGKIPVNRSSIDIVLFVRNLAQEIMKTTGYTHVIKVSCVEPTRVIYSDEKLLRNIIINLLTNAIKFSPDHKQVDIGLTFTHQVTSIRVSDYGIGISDQDQESLFQAFHRGTNAQGINGTGLGLSIVKKAVELLGGNVGVTSTIGAGTEFMVELPV